MSAYHVSYTVLGTEDEAMNKKDRFSVSSWLYLSRRRKKLKSNSDKTYEENGTR